MWEGTDRQCRQLPGVGKLLSEKLAAAGMQTLEALELADPRRIEMVTQRNYPFGDKLKEDVLRSLPAKCSLNISYTGDSLVPDKLHL